MASLWLCVCFGWWVVGVGAQSAETYVALPPIGSLEPGCGSFGTPCGTLQLGIQATAFRGNLTIMSGVYSGEGNTGLTITQSIIMTGAGFPVLDGNQAQILHVAAGSVICVDLVFQNGRTPAGMSGSGGAIQITSQDPCAFFGCTFLNNNAEGNGGAISSTSSGGVSFDACRFELNTATKLGGAVYVSSSTNSSSNSFIQTNFVANSVTSSDTGGAPCGGGAVYSSDIANFQGCTFTANTAVATSSCYGGGGAVLAAGTVLIKATHFSRNSANGLEYYGGAIFVSPFTSISVTNSQFIENSVTGLQGSSDRPVGGGALFVADGPTTSYKNLISGCYFLLNTVTGYGTSLNGGALLLAGPITSIEASQFHENSISTTSTSTMARGGAIALWANLMFVAGCAFVRNNVTGPGQAQAAGGAVYAVGLGSVFTDSNFTDNVTPNQQSLGGALFTAGGDVQNCLFAGNSAYQGGAVYVFTDEYNISSSSFTSNTAYSSGGGLYAAGGVTYLSSLNWCSFKLNLAGQGGGVFLGADSQLTITHSDFFSNQANSGLSEGGGLYATAFVSLSSCSFISNSAGRGGAMHWAMVGTSSPQLLGQFVGGTVTQNQAPLGAGFYIGGSQATTNSNAVVDTTLISDNSAPQSEDCGGAGAYVNAASVSFVSSRIIDNSLGCSHPNGTAVAVVGGGIVHLQGSACVVRDNTASLGGVQQLQGVESSFVSCKVSMACNFLSTDCLQCSTNSSCVWDQSARSCAWSPSAHSAPACPFRCSASSPCAPTGVCEQGACVCESLYTGPTCAGLGGTAVVLIIVIVLLVIAIAVALVALTLRYRRRALHGAARTEVLSRELLDSNDI